MAKNQTIEIATTGKTDFAGSLKLLIEQSGKTRYEIAAMSGISEGALSLIYSGKRPASFETLRAVAASLGLKVTVRVG